MVIRRRINVLNGPIRIVLLWWPLSGVGLGVEVLLVVQGVHGYCLVLGLLLKLESRKRGENSTC